MFVRASWAFRLVYVSLHAPTITRATPIHLQIYSLMMFACVRQATCLCLCACNLRACLRLDVHRCGCVCVSVFFFLGSVWLQQWTSVNKLCADCIYLIHMLVNYTAVCCCWYVWKEKSLCSRSLVWGTEIIAKSAQMWLLILTKTGLFLCFKEHFADTRHFFTMY